jgi:hypothetical protein
MLWTQKGQSMSMDEIHDGRSKTSIPVTGVVPLEQMAGDDEEDTTLLREMAERAETFLKSFSWCLAIRESFFGAGVGKIIAVFLFRISPARPDIDEWLWVVVGDLPPAYLVTECHKTPSEAIEAYIEEMSKWVEHARRGQESADVIPVNVPATPEWAENLNSRLETLRTTILPEITLRLDPPSKL